MVKTAAYPSTAFWNTRILTTSLQQEKYIFPIIWRIDKFSRLLLRTCLHGSGKPQIGEVTYIWLPHLSGKRAQINIRDYINRRVTPPKRVTSPTWGLLSFYKVFLFNSIWNNYISFMYLSVLQNCYFVNLSFKLFLKSVILKLVRLTCLDKPSYLQVSWIVK